MVRSAAFYPKLNILQLSAARKKGLNAQREKDAQRLARSWRKKKTLRSHLEQLKKYASLGEKTALVDTRP